MLSGMIRQPFDHLAASRFLLGVWRSVRQRAAGLCSPKTGRRRLAGKGRLLIAWAGIIVGLMVQLVALWFLGEMIDLCISLMEVWAELARKHLELTL